MILVEGPTAQGVALTVREFSVSAICGSPEFAQNVSRHIAEQVK
jgi:hypothetical protein